MKTTKADIESFLSLRRIAMAGVSRDQKHFSRAIWKDFRSRGYELVAVNPAAGEIDGQPCFTSVADVQPPPEGVLIMTKPAQSAAVVRDSAAAGVRSIWLYRSAGAGSESAKALEACRRQGMVTVSGECPLMWLSNAESIHKFHKTLRSWFGLLPK